MKIEKKKKSVSICPISSICGLLRGISKNLKICKTQKVNIPKIIHNPELHKMEKLIKLRSKDKNLPIRCYESGEEVSTQDLLEGVYDKSEIVEKDNLGKY